MNAFFPLASLFDWSGSLFLAFYAIAFVGALAWSLKRRRTILGSLNPAPDTIPTLQDPIEIAYLAGGPSRCTEVALASLIKNGSLTWRPGSLLTNGKFTVASELPADAHWFERALYTSILAEKRSGMSLPDLPTVVKKHITPLESRLASLGLRPTASELSGKGMSASLPLLTLLIIGGIRLAFGFTREMPVGFLIAFLLITFVTMLVISGTIGKITPAGQSLLDRMRDGRKSTPEPGLVGVALFGLAGATAYAHMPEFTPDMITEIQKTSTSSSGGCGAAGGDGCSSGCGGGCGGCGGCGG